MVDNFKNYPLIAEIGEVYNTNIKPLIYKPSKIILTWDFFKIFVVDTFYIAIFKLIISISHDWNGFIATFEEFCKPYLVWSRNNLIQILAFNFSILHVYFLQPTLIFMKSVLIIPFKGLTPLIATNWVGDIMWCLTAYYTKFQELYWRYLWDYKYVKKPIQWLKEFYYDNGEKVYTGVKYEVNKVWVSLIDGEEEALKSVQGEAFVSPNQPLSSEPGSPTTSETIKAESAPSTSKIPTTPLETGHDSGRVSPVEEQAQTVQNEWSGNEDKTPKGQNKQIETDSPISENSDGSLASTESGKQKQLQKYFADPGDKTPKASKTFPLHVEQLPDQLRNMINPVYQGVGVVKNDHVMYYERQPLTFNKWVGEGGAEMYSRQPDREHEIQGLVSWKYFLMTNPTVISMLCFSSTLIAGLAIKTVIKLSAETAIAVLM